MADEAVKVLLIEDNPGDARLIREALADAATMGGLTPTFELIGADRLAAGLARLAGGGIDVVLLDLSLPDSQGFQTFATACERADGVPIVVLSGLADEALAARAVREGAQDYLVKGQVDGQLLGRTLCYAIERSRAEREREQLIREQVARAQAEAERDRLQQVLDALPEGIAIADAHGEIVMSNAAARAIWGQAPPPSGVRGYGAFGVFYPDGSPWPAEEMPLARSVLRGELVRGEQMLIRDAATGREVPILVNSAPLCDAGGAVVGGVAVFQDISPIKDLERQKDEFLAAASHELKTPLATIKGLAQLLLRRVARSERPEDPRLVDGLQRIDQMTTRLTGMVNDLLDVAHVQMGRPLDLNRAPTDLVGLAEQVAAEWRPTSQRHAIRVESAAPTLVGAWDAGRLRRVLSSLLGNAIRYSPDGGDVTLTLGREDNGTGSWAVLAVEDRGVGIPAEELPHVFERFYRGSNVAGRIAGTGIGLTGSWQIVQQHGGKIEVASRNGGGTTFTVRLPLDE